MSVPVCRLVKEHAPALSVGATSANLMALGTDIALLEQCGAILLHFDVMDGHFAPQLTMGPAFVKAVKTAMLKDVHLMIQNPAETLPQYAAAGADILTVHVESCTHVRYALQSIASLKNANDATRGIARGIALNPGTPLAVLEPLLDDVDLVVLLAINPGFGGQKLLPDTGRRAAQVRELAAKAGRQILLCIDGGVTKENIAEVAAMGPDVVVSGSAVFEKKAVKENFTMMTSSLRGN